MNGGLGRCRAGQPPALLQFFRLLLLLGNTHPSKFLGGTACQVVYLKKREGKGERVLSLSTSISIFLPLPSASRSAGDCLRCCSRYVANGAVVSSTFCVSLFIRDLTSLQRYLQISARTRACQQVA